MTAPRAEYSHLCRTVGALYLRDLGLSSRRLPDRATPDGVISELATDAKNWAGESSLVYTAFDGDHLELGGFMRRAVWAHNCVPVNPDNVLGYKETVDARQNKADVLRDDLSLLRACDQLWVFTDVDPEQGSLCDLAEGVLIEIAYFVTRHPDRPVSFVALDHLVGIHQVSVRQIEISAERLLGAMKPQDRSKIIRIVETDAELPNVEYQIIDPTDFKYCHFVRADGYATADSGRAGLAPLIPSLSLPINDCGGGVEAIGRVVLGWVALQALAQSCGEYPALEARGRPADVTRLLRSAWMKSNPDAVPTPRAWATHHIPKARDPLQWTITDAERSKF